MWNLYYWLINWLIAMKKKIKKMFSTANTSMD